MVITEDELVECLSEMSLLQELFIQDNTKASGLECENHILLTDSLLRRLAWRPDSSSESLAPDLTVGFLLLYIRMPRLISGF
jgi:hypothetical protein